MKIHFNILSNHTEVEKNHVSRKMRLKFEMQK